MSHQQYSIISGLYGGRLLNIFERSAGVVAMSAVSDLVNGWPGGIIQASRDDLFVSPLYLVNQLYSETRGSHLLETIVQSPTFDSGREGKNVPYIDAVASKSADGKQIFIKIVNSDLNHAILTTIRVRETRLAPMVNVSTVTSASLDDYNSFRNPNAVQIKRSTIAAGSTFDAKLPPHSVSVLTLDLTQ